MSLRHLLILTMTLLTCLCFSKNTAHAESATFLTPTDFTDDQAIALSTAGDNAGFNIPQGQSLRLLFDQPFAATQRDNVTVFTLPGEGGIARGTIRFGRIENGVETIARNRNFTSGRTVSLNNLLNQGCGNLGGCNFIEVLTRSNRRDTEVRVDYIQINGEVVSVTAPTPEPQTWALMIIGFFAVAWKLKSERKNARLKGINLNEISQDPAGKPRKEQEIFYPPQQPHHQAVLA